eukprot:1591142-Rhodomonas_salina.1
MELFQLDIRHCEDERSGQETRPPQSTNSASRSEKGAGDPGAVNGQNQAGTVDSDRLPCGFTMMKQRSLIQIKTQMQRFSHLLTTACVRISSALQLTRIPKGGAFRWYARLSQQKPSQSLSQPQRQVPSQREQPMMYSGEPSGRVKPVFRSLQQQPARGTVKYAALMSRYKTQHFLEKRYNEAETQWSSEGQRTIVSLSVRQSWMMHQGSSTDFLGTRPRA